MPRILFSNVKVTRLQLLLAVGAYLALSFWTLRRVLGVNPSILQDEFIYAYSSRDVDFWEQSPPWDFGNYLFNFVYHSTLICGDQFYSCAKILNLVFISAFILTLFLVAIRFVPFWWSLMFAIAVFLSPISVYVSMYLPEPLYYFLLGSALLFLVRSVELDQTRDWIGVGVALGLAALTKPHALLSLMAFAIFIGIYSLSAKQILAAMVRRGGLVLAAFLVTRLAVGFLLAGPKALNLLGAYGAGQGLNEFVSGVAGGQLPDSDSLVGAGVVKGALGLFFPQLTTHVFALVALLGAGLALLALVLARSRSGQLSRPRVALALAISVWLGVMVIAIVLFTGWITGSGDDHTNRILLRYYDFLFPVVWLGALVGGFDPKLAITPTWIRYAAVAAPLAIAGLSLGPHFAQLTVQIADAPSLAGLIVDRLVFDSISVLVVLAILTIAFFPKYARHAVTTSLVASLTLTGFHAQEQYIFFRSQDSAADVAGQTLRTTLDAAELEEIAIVAGSRFDARVASFWMDSNNEILLLPPDSVFGSEFFNTNPTYFLVIGNSTPVFETRLIIEGSGYKLYEVAD